jgi:hypothetical protein
MRTAALLLSVLVLGGVTASCDDSKSQPDTVIIKDKGPLVPDTGIVDLPVRPDLPAKLDQAVTESELPVKRDAQQDSPIVTQDGKKDWPIVTQDGGKKDGVLPVPTNSKCASPKTLTLSGAPAKVVEQGWTDGAADEFAAVDCGGELYDPVAGPQVYFRVTLAGGKKYKAILTGEFDCALYAFPAATACTATAISGACKSPGGDNLYSSDKIGASSSEIVRIAPVASGDWIIVVDSWSTSSHGKFTLTIAEIVPPTNGTCTSAKALALVAGKAVENGDTLDSANEFGSTIKCGGTAAFEAPQVYYRLTVTSGKAMKITIDPTFSAHGYVFPVSASCSAAAIETACASGGATGMVYGSIYPSSPESFIFNPTAAGDYILAIDATAAGKGGPFTLTVEEFTPPTNAKCAAPQTITLTTSPATVTGDTSFSTDQTFTPAVACGLAGLSGPQLYYRLSLLAGKTYTIEVTPAAGFDVAIWAFADATCTAATLQAQCSAKGMAADVGYAGIPEKLTIAPTTTADTIIALDGWKRAAAGAFSLKVSWQ